MPGGESKFILVATGGALDTTAVDHLARHVATLDGTAFFHVLVDDQPEAGAGTAPEPPAPLIVEWFASSAPGAADWADALGIAEGRLVCDEVSELLRWQRPGTVYSAADGVSHICRVGRTAGLTMEQFEEHWTQVHRPLAQTHHFGMELYVQNLARHAAGGTGSGIDGIAELRFRSAEALANEMYDSPEGLQAISTDVAKFVGSASCGMYRRVPM